jgi:hypothetical protein
MDKKEINDFTTGVKLEEQFFNRFKNKQILKDIVNKIDKTGTPMFTEQDVYITTHPLARLLRIIFVDNHITKEYFDKAHAEYSKKYGFTDELTAVTINSNKNNLLTAISKPRITFNVFEQIMTIIFGYKLCNMTCTFETPEGEFKSYKFDDYKK